MSKSATLEFPELGAEVLPPPAGAKEQTSAISAGISSVQGEVAKFDHIAAGISAIEATHPKNVIVAAINTASGMKLAEAAWRAYRTPRLEVERARKAAKAPVLSLGKAIDAFAGSLEDRLREGEDHYKSQIDKEEARRQEEREEAERREAGRIAKHESGIATIRSYLSRCAGLPSSRIEMGIDQLSAMTFTTEAWEEFAVLAASAQCETLESMRALLAKTRAAEEQDAETRRLRAVVEEQARELAELRAQAAKVAAAEAERLELQQLKEDAQRAALADAIVAESLRQAEEDGDKPAAQEAAPVCAAFAGLSFADPVAEPPVKEPAYMIGDLCHKVGAGFSMTAEFVAGLGFKPSKSDGRSKLYTETQCAGIKAALIARIEERL